MALPFILLEKSDCGWINVWKTSPKERQVFLAVDVSASYFPSISPPCEDLQGMAAPASNYKQDRVWIQ